MCSTLGNRVAARSRLVSRAATLAERVSCGERAAPRTGTGQHAAASSDKARSTRPNSAILPAHFTSARPLRAERWGPFRRLALQLDFGPGRARYGRSSSAPCGPELSAVQPSPMAAARALRPPSVCSSAHAGGQAVVPL